ncbi:MAG: ABC transporter ATP-binding protein [SAR324 cluster bacterium]|nr:ABC transporter ATP-binding protein [SAR324 cluster bacterium]
MKSQEIAIHVNNVSKDYLIAKQSYQVLYSLEASIFQGEWITLLGKSGSGKSTLLNLLAGLDSPTSGTITLLQKDLTSLSETERTVLRRHAIGFIFQSYNLIPTLTVEENLKLPLELIGRTASASEIKKMLSEVEMDQALHKFPDQLSGGEQQRIAIARALIHDPSIIFADEPTGNLDDQTSYRVLTWMSRLIKEHGKTLIVATHSKSVTAFSDRIWHLHNGALKEELVS